MAILFLMIGTLGGIASTAWLIFSATEDSEFNVWAAILLVVCILMIIFPFIKNKEPITKEHFSIETNYFENIKYNEIVTVEYDLYTYYWWTFNIIHNNGVMHNLQITFNHGKVED